jgi:hypothetical protein
MGWLLAEPNKLASDKHSILLKQWLQRSLYKHSSRMTHVYVCLKHLTESSRWVSTSLDTSNGEKLSVTAAVNILNITSRHPNLQKCMFLAFLANFSLP